MWEVVIGLTLLLVLTSCFWLVCNQCLSESYLRWVLPKNMECASVYTENVSELFSYSHICVSTLHRDHANLYCSNFCICAAQASTLLFSFWWLILFNLIGLRHVQIVGKTLFFWVCLWGCLQKRLTFELVDLVKKIIFTSVSEYRPIPWGP